ncbi:hypothetical protein GCM10010124_41130 [Pilimelia terevasa]|uniref:Uncharacterized protein n=1 Tax=Pilimelia terevasa TaxID=53372 RepID=A0A8J3FJZ0_9ACTN|nr:hypothetical protein [Pilimelia terevasa]GGK44067.1 hypothetical protein GCM10010124_41130 [Pilimelia terevasa]
MAVARAGIDCHLGRYPACEQDTGKKLVDHEARIRGLERGRWPLPSLALIISALALMIPVVSTLTKK